MPAWEGREKERRQCEWVLEVTILYRMPIFLISLWAGKLGTWRTQLFGSPKSTVLGTTILQHQLVNCFFLAGRVDIISRPTNAGYVTYPGSVKRYY